MPNIAQSVAATLDDNGCVVIDVACLNCGYNLRTQPVSGRCPECAQEVRFSTSGYVVRLDADGRIMDDLACITCGYNLRLQPATGSCPECGNRVAPSTRGFYLRFAPPHWVARHARGLLFIVISFGGLALVWLAQVFGFMLLAAGPTTTVWVTLLVVILLPVVGFGVLGIVGVFFATSRDPVPGATPKRACAPPIAMRNPDMTSSKIRSAPTPALSPDSAPGSGRRWASAHCSARVRRRSLPPADRRSLRCTASP